MAPLEIKQFLNIDPEYYEGGQSPSQPISIKKAEGDALSNQHFFEIKNTLTTSPIRYDPIRLSLPLAARLQLGTNQLGLSSSYQLSPDTQSTGADPIPTHSDKEILRKELRKEFSLNPGRYMPDSPILGLRTAELDKYAEFAKQHPAFIRFGHALYYGYPHLPEYDLSQGGERSRNTLNMIPLSLKEKADQIAKELYFEYCTRYYLDPEKAVQWSNDVDREGVTWVYDVENEWNTWNVHVYVETRGMLLTGTDQSYYSPPFLVALHELEHVERTKPFEPKRQFTRTGDSIHEIAPMLDQIIYQDTIYKHILSIPIEQEVYYSEKLPCNLGNNINLGLIANTFRRLKSLYGSIEAALMSSEGQKFVKSYYDNTGTTGKLHR